MQIPSLKKPLKENLEQADEIKIRVEDEDSIDYWMDEIGTTIRSPHVWLHLEWSQRKNILLMEMLNEKVKHSDGRFRIGYQLHKLFGVD